MAYADTEIHTEHWEGQKSYAEAVPEEEIDMRDSKERHTVTRKTKRLEGNKDDRIAMDSLKPWEMADMYSYQQADESAHRS